MGIHASFISKKDRAEYQASVESMYKNINQIYSNKSGDEYKMAGDITKSPVYNKIQRMVTDLRLLKGLSGLEIEDLKKMFDRLHRPIFKTTVSRFIQKKDDNDIVAVVLFTLGYRVLVSELGRIYASTEATTKGFVYKPDKISRKNSMGKFIRIFNDKLDTELNKFVRNNTKTIVGESFAMEAFIGSAATVTAMIAALSDKIAPFFEEIGAWMDLLHLGDILNPVSFVNHLLSKHYQNKVDKCNEVYDLYIATKQAYDEYMRLPQSQRSAKVEEKYKRNIEKYDIKMKNLAAQIAHYDERSQKEAAEEARKKKTSTSPKTEEPKNDDTDTTDTSSDDNSSKDDGGLDF